MKDGLSLFEYEGQQAYMAYNPDTECYVIYNADTDEPIVTGVRHFPPGCTLRVTSIAGLPLLPPAPQP